MWWIVFGVVVTLIGVAGVAAVLNSVRFARRVAAEAGALFADGAVPPAFDLSACADIPAPVRRYLARAVGDRRPSIVTVRLTHGGTFRASLDGAWLPIRGEQYFTADPPGFVWWGRVRVGPGLWIDARDRSVRGEGNMLVTAESTIPLADSRGAELDQGALMRLLGEMTWFPTALADPRWVRWSAVDDRRAIATLALNGRTAAGTFTFGDDDLPASFTADRYRDVGGGRSVLTPFVGRSLDFRPVDGVLVPHRMIGAWVVDGSMLEYVDFRVDALQFDARGQRPTSSGGFSARNAR